MTLPLPVRLAPSVIVIHELLLAAVHAQPDVVVTLVELLPPDPRMVRLVGETVKAQEAAACVTVSV